MSEEKNVALEAAAKPLKDLNGVYVPQYYDVRQKEWLPLTGTDGSLHYIDRDKAKTFYQYSSEAKPVAANTGDVLYQFDTQEGFIFDGKKWVLI